MKLPRVSRRKEIIKIRAEINGKERKETIAKINKTKSLFFDKVNKIDKKLADSSRKKKESIKYTNIWRLNNTLLNNQQIMEEIKKEIKICTKDK